MNTFGRIYRLTDFGESHGPAIGGVIDGVPAGFLLDKQYVQERLDRRRPGRSLTSARKEEDCVEWLSGLADDGRTLGSPIGFLIRNTDARSADYEPLHHVFRPGHADYTTRMRFGLHEHRGGGRASARQTISRVVAGAVASQMLLARGIEIRAFISAIGEWSLPSPYAEFPPDARIQSSAIFCPEERLSSQIEEWLKTEIIGRDSVGSRVSLICRGVAPGLGSPVYGKLTARLAQAMMSINAARAVEFGLGAKSSSMTGIEAIDAYTGVEFIDNKMRIHTASNLAGGIEGGMTTGEDICLSVYFKPTPSRPYAVESISDQGERVTINPGGRHDPCVAIRAVPVVEAMAAMVLLDELLLARCARW